MHDVKHVIPYKENTKLKLHISSYKGYYKNYRVFITENKMHHWDLRIEPVMYGLKTINYECPTVKAAREIAIQEINKIEELKD